MPDVVSEHALDESHTGPQRLILGFMLVFKKVAVCQERVRPKGYPFEGHLNPSRRGSQVARPESFWVSKRRVLMTNAVAWVF